LKLSSAASFALSGFAFFVFGLCQINPVYGVVAFGLNIMAVVQFMLVGGVHVAQPFPGETFGQSLSNFVLPTLLLIPAIIELVLLDPA